MGRTLVGRAAFSAALVGLALAQAMAGCGSTNSPGGAQGGNGGEATGGASEGGSGTGDSGGPGDSAGTGDTGSGGTGVTTSGGGAGLGSGGTGSGGRITGLGGKSGTAGSGGVPIGLGGLSSGGYPETGGSAGSGVATGGAPSCLAGAPCTCKKLVGTTECSSEGVATCSCPPAAECAATGGAPCFEPCGGEPFGAWVLEDSCFPATAVTTSTQGCQQLIQGTPGANDLRLRILDGGDLQLVGTEDWSISAQVALACLSLTTVNSCSVATFWPGALLFSADRDADCAKNACGVCDCASDTQAEVPAFYDRWSRDGTNLQLGFVTTPYCVTGGELWLGGSDVNGNPKVSYKFKKQSCTGTPVPCAQRTAETCVQGFNCTVGLCKATTGTQQRCSTAFSSTECGVLQGCSWDPAGCAGTAAAACEFDNCGVEPGCTWGAPRERCGGQATLCSDRELSQCAGSGCALSVCQNSFQEYGDCTLLQNATECGKAPGCVFTAGACTGQAACPAQIDVAICSKLQCFPENNCDGTPTECSTLSVANCHSVPGCRLEW